MSSDKEQLPSPEQRRALCDLMHAAFVELRYLTGDQAHDLADAFHNVPKTMYGWGHWSVEGARAKLMHYQAKHKANLGFDYVAAFDAVFKLQ
jgi:hypothetical protein